MMLKEERMKVLEMLKENIITVEEAEKLLNAIDSNDEVLVREKNKFKMLKVIIDSTDGEKVRMQIPIEFAKLLKSDKFNLNLDKANINIDELIAMIDSGVMGDLVNIDADGNKVTIRVE